MKLNLLWTITVLLLVGYFIIQYGLIQQYDFSRELDLFSFVIDVISNLILVFTVGAGLGALLAFIPFKQWKYTQKFKRTFPLATSLTIIVLLFSFGYVAYLDKVKGIKLTPLVLYDKIEVPKTLNCSTIQNGEFETEHLIITRQGDNQTQIKKETKEKAEFKIKWLSNCEYILTPINNPTEILRVKIINIRADEYDCYVTIDKYAQRHTIKRLKSGKQLATIFERPTLN